MSVSGYDEVTATLRRVGALAVEASARLAQRRAQAIAGPYALAVVTSSGYAVIRFRNPDCATLLAIGSSWDEALAQLELEAELTPHGGRE